MVDHRVERLREEAERVGLDAVLVTSPPSIFYLTGLDPEVLAQVQRNRTVESAGDVRLFVATDVIGEASLEAYRHAEAWLATES